MFDPRNDLPLGSRTKAVKLLNERLVDAIDRGTQVAQYGAHVRAGIAAAATLGDADTSDLLTGVSREAHKYLWFLEAHRHGTR